MKILWLLVTLSSLGLTTQTAGAATRCPEPTRGVQQLFALVKASDTTVDQLDSFLKAHPVSASATDEVCFSPLIYPLAAHRDDVFRFLYEYFESPNPNLADPKVGGYSLYILALQYGDWPTIQLLRASGADFTKAPAVLRGPGITELFYVAERDSVENVNGFLSIGESANATDENGDTPLFYAAQYSKNPAVIAALVQAGANPNQTDNLSMAPLIQAAQKNGKASVTKELIRDGADPNYAVDPLKTTPLMYAARKNPNPKPVIEALIQGGARITTKDKDGYTAYDHAKAAGRSADVLSLLALPAISSGGTCGIKQNGSCFQLPGSTKWLCHSPAEGCYIMKGRRGCTIACDNPEPVSGN